MKSSKNKKMKLDRNMKISGLVLVAVVSGVIGAFLQHQSSAEATCSGGFKPVFRMYNSSKKNHFYTMSKNERTKFKRHNYRYQGVAFCAVKKITGDPADADAP